MRRAAPVTITLRPGENPQYYESVVRTQAELGLKPGEWPGRVYIEGEEAPYVWAAGIRRDFILIAVTYSAGSKEVRITK